MHNHLQIIYRPALFRRCFMSRPSWKDRFSYWFDNHMSKGSIGLIRILLIFSLLAVLLVSGLIMAFGFNDGESFAGVLWNSIATIINAWMPSFEEGSIGYLLFMALTAFAGLLVTSVLIGIFTSAIEERITALRKGNSPVIEEDHIIVIGFYPGEYTLLRQLILAAEDNPCTIVIGAEAERDEIESYIRDNVEVPKNIRIICRTIDPFDPGTMEKLSVKTCRTVIISPTDDNTTIKILLAVSSLLKDTGNRKIMVNAITSKEENRFPSTLARRMNVVTLQSNDTLAKIMAHSCTQTGLSEVFREIFNFEGSELYLVKLAGQSDIPFEKLMRRMDGGVPVGICRNGEIRMNPPRDLMIRESDELLVYAETGDSAFLKEDETVIPEDLKLRPVKPEKNTTVLIFGNRSTLKIILRELPDNVRKAVLVNYDRYNYDLIRSICESRGIELEITEGDTRNENVLYEMVKTAEHIIIQSNYGDEEEADMNTIFLLLNLRELKTRYHLKFNITAEMRKERNQVLVSGTDRTDFIVASNMSSLFLAQLAESPRLIGAFREILSNEGNELYMKRAGNLNCAGTYKVSELRQILLRQGYIFLGYMSGSSVYRFNPPLNESVTIRPGDSLIVFGEH